MIRILIVHGCPLFRAGLRSYLLSQQDCHIVGEATHLEEVLSLATIEHPDVVLLDGGLTSADPVEITRQVREAGVGGILVFAPPDVDEELLYQFVKYGAAAFELDTISGEELLAKIRRMCCGEYLITEGVLEAQAARRERLARMQREALLAARSQEALLAARSSASPLSGQEQDILEQFAKGRGSTTQVAAHLGINPYSAKNRIEGILRKLDVENRTAAVVMAMRNGWVAVD
jgi:DNA-binding NarL/FixJ family response regulator